MNVQNGSSVSCVVMWKVYSVNMNSLSYAMCC